MKLSEVKTVAEKLYELAAELLRCVDVDEQEHERYIEDVKKTVARLFSFQSLKRRAKTPATKTLCKNRQLN